MKFNVNIASFEGPLDLMLFLIKEKKLDLFDLNISILIEQYEAFLHQMKEQQFEIATEYIAELAGLIEYKSKQLIPQEKGDFESEASEDPQSIVARLLEYSAVKDASGVLKTMYEQRAQHFSALSLTPPIEVKVNYDHHMQDLVKAMNKVLIRYKLTTPYDMTTTFKEMSVEDRMEIIINFAKSKREQFSLDEVFKTCDSLESMIVSFLAILDCIRLHSLDYILLDDTIYLKWSEYS
jgi:segregation and condensation protein A